MTDLIPEKLNEIRTAIAALQADEIAFEYGIPWTLRSHGQSVWSSDGLLVADTMESRIAAYIAAADPQTVLALVEEVERLRLERDFLVSEYERAVGCDSQGYIHASMNLFNAIANPRCDKIADLTGDVARLQARVAVLEKVREAAIVADDFVWGGAAGPYMDPKTTVFWVRQFHKVRDGLREALNTAQEDKEVSDE